MPKNPVEIPKHLRGQISQENQEWFTFYKQHPNSSKTKSYLVKIEKFLGYKEHNHKPFNTFTIEDVRKFKQMLKSVGFEGGGINPYISAISGCAKLLREEHPDFEEHFLYDVTDLLDKTESVSSGEVLSLAQINCIRKYNKDQGIVYEYIFELFFQLGIQKEKLHICQPKYQDIENHRFVSETGDVPIPYNVKIASLLENIRDTDQDELEKTFNNVHHRYFKKITEHLRNEKIYSGKRVINSKYLTQSHAAYFILCPNCKQVMENIADNWVLVRNESDDMYRLACTECKGENI